MTTKGFFVLLKRAVLRKKYFFFTAALIIFVLGAGFSVKKFLCRPAAPPRAMTGVSVKGGGEARSDLEIIKKTVKEKKYLESETLLNDFLKVKHSKEEKYEARFMLGYVYLSLGQWKRAFTEFKLVASASPPHKRSPDATYMAAELLDRKFSDRKKALKYYKKYVRMWPQGRLAGRVRKKLLSLTR